jgi:hypothetical protein
MTTQRFLVGPTSATVRSRYPGEYVICVNPTVKRDLGLGSDAAIEHERSVGTSPGATTLALAVHARVVDDSSVALDQILADQSCRNAVGIPYEYDRSQVRVAVHPLHVTFSQRLRRLAARLLGRRYVILRVHKGDIPDMEKRLARMSASLFPVLGVTEGRRVVVWSVCRNGDGPYRLRHVYVRAFPFTDSLIARMTKLDEPRPDARFIKADELLGVTPDVGELFLDSREREALGVEALDPVTVRRDVGERIRRESLSAGLVFFVSLLAISQGLPGDTTWLRWGIALAVALVLATLVVVSNLRSETS